MAIQPVSFTAQEIKGKPVICDDVILHSELITLTHIYIDVDGTVREL